MRFIATFEHSPDNCWGREENQSKATAFVGDLSGRAERHDVVLHGAYSTPNEHRFYFVLEAESLEAVTGFLGSPFLEDHDGDIAPVITMQEAVDTVIGA